MAISKDLLLAILSLDAYNQGYGKGINYGKKTIGSATFYDDKGDAVAQSAGFYAVAYKLDDGTKIISYRGTDDYSPIDWDSWWRIDTWRIDTSSDVFRGWITGGGAWKTDQVRLATEFYQSVTNTSGGDPRTGNAFSS